MASDEKETASRASGDEKAGRVARALALARDAAKADREQRGGRWLALFPASVGIILMLLLMPRATKPESIPLPRLNQHVVDGVGRADDARAAAAESRRLPTDVLAVGSAIRVLSGAEARGLDEPGVVDARRQLDGALRDLARRQDATPDLVALRALQTRHFIDSLARWEATGETSEDFIDLASSFVQRASENGWALDRHIIIGDAERRVMFKTVWNVLVNVESSPAFAITLDEQRALYTFYLQHPHPAESRRLALESERRAATTPEACVRANAEQSRQTEMWRADKIRKLGAIDPSYPTAYALGVAFWRAGRFDLAADSFNTFLGQHPDGPYALRARNHLKAALTAGGSL